MLERNECYTKGIYLSIERRRDRERAKTIALAVWRFCLRTIGSQAGGRQPGSTGLRGRNVPLWRSAGVIILACLTLLVSKPLRGYGVRLLLVWWVFV